MANVPGPQPDIKFCPICMNELRSVPRNEMISRGNEKADGTVSPDTHTYDCSRCSNRFEINQSR